MKIIDTVQYSMDAMEDSVHISPTDLEQVFNSTLFLVRFHDFHVDFYNHYLKIAIYIFAVIGNVLCLNVTVGKTFWNHSKSAFYLASILLFGTIYLTFSMKEIYLGDRPWQYDWTDVDCKVINYVNSVAVAMISISITAFTIERFVAIYCHSVHNFLVLTRRFSVIFLGLSVTLICHLPVALYTEASNQMCRWEPGFSNHVIYDIIRLGSTFSAPAITIIACNLLVLLRSKDIGENLNDDPVETINEKVRMLRVVSISYLLLQAPASIIRGDLMLDDQLQPNIQLIVAYDVAQLLYNLTFVLNLIIFTIASKKFRKLMTNVFKDHSKNKLSAAVYSVYQYPIKPQSSKIGKALYKQLLIKNSGSIPSAWSYEVIKSQDTICPI